MGEHSHILMVENCGTNKAVCAGHCHGESTSYGSTISLDIFSRLSPSDLPVVMLINYLAWRNKFLMNNALTVRKDQRTFDVLPDLPHFLHAWRERANLCSPHSIVTKSCFERFMDF
jgi:hypothetical protein